MTKRTILAAASLCLLVAAPAAAEQRSPSAHCNDGTYYYGTSRREACAHHRGVSEWLGPVSQSQLRSSTPRVRPQARKPDARRSPPRTTTRARPTHPRPSGAVTSGTGRHRAGGAKDAAVGRRAPSGATARCKDGTWSQNPRRSGACVRHGGIASWLGPR